MLHFEFDMSVVEDSALKSTADTVQRLTVKGYDLVITTHGDELSFNTYTDAGEPVSYYDAHKLFDMSDMIALKRGLLNMIEQHFYYGPPGSYLFYAPSCPRRDLYVVVKEVRLSCRCYRWYRVLYHIKQMMSKHTVCVW